MGNAIIGGRKKAKVTKLDGETFKLNTPTRANDVVNNYPGHALLDSQAVKHFGLRAKPLDPNQELKPNKLYFLVELPKIQHQPKPLQRRARSSGIRGMNAMERLDFLMLSKRSVSDVSRVKPSSSNDGPGGPTRIKMKLPKAQLDKLMAESRDENEVAEKIISLYMENNAAVNGGGRGGGTTEAKTELHNHKPSRKRVSFSPVEEGEIREETAPQ